VCNGRLHAHQGERVWQEACRLLGRCVCLRAAALGWAGRLQRLFFLHEGQDMSRFLVADLGILRYPCYPVHRTRAVWPTRGALLAYEAALAHAEALDATLEVNAQTPDALTPWVMSAYKLAILLGGHFGGQSGCCLGLPLVSFGASGMMLRQKSERQHEGCMWCLTGR
jgi:hypothetical protein